MRSGTLTAQTTEAHAQIVETPVAILTIKDAASLTPGGRVAIAAWLRMHARDVVNDGPNYAKNFRGRCF